MAPTLTLHQGDAQASYTEHPIEIAREMLMIAADMEQASMAGLMRYVAEALPEREPIIAIA